MVQVPAVTADRKKRIAFESRTRQLSNEGSLKENSCADTSNQCAYFHESVFEHKDAEKKILDSCVGSPTDLQFAVQSRMPPEIMPSYLAHLWATPLLTPPQELREFRKFNFLKFLVVREKRRENEPIDDCPERLRLSSLGNRVTAVRNLIVESNLRLVVSIARRYANGFTEQFDEMVSGGNATLIRAVDKFDYRRGVRFSTYAYRAIQRSMFSEFRDGKRRDRKTLNDSEGLADMVAGDAGACDRAELNAQEAFREARQLISQLGERERQIVMARFGINRKHEGVAFHVIAKEIGLSTTRTVQLFHRSLQRMRFANRKGSLGDS